MLFEDKKRLIFTLALCAVTVVIWLPLLQAQHRVLEVAFLDVGQGDSILITTPSQRQVLIDGGPHDAVLRALGNHMSWLDRRIDVVVATHPDADHIGGLIPVLERFEVDAVMFSGVAKETLESDALYAQVTQKNIQRIEARRGQDIQLGDGVVLSILFPDRDVSGVEANDGSIVTRLTYGGHSFLFTGDAPQSIERYITTLDESTLKSTVLKVGHHGSHTSTDEVFLGYVDPEYAILSRGCNNSYGHPHEEIVRLLQEQGGAIYDTCEDGDVVFTSDGEALNVKHSR